MSFFRWHNFVTLTLLAFLPVSLSADDSGRAILRSSGGVLVNKSAAPQSLAVFPGDLIETQANSPARIEYPGSSVDIGPESVIQLESGGINLDHGSVIVTSFQQFRVRAGCVLATPATADMTIYTVTDTNSRVRVAAQEKDVNLDSGSRPKRAGRPESFEQVVVHQGEEKSREEHCGAVDIHTVRGGAGGGILNSPWVVGTAGVAIVGGTICVLVCLNPEPVSPSKPN